jgi:hypothetical protein
VGLGPEMKQRILKAIDRAGYQALENNLGSEDEGSFLEAEYLRDLVVEENYRVVWGDDEAAHAFIDLTEEEQDALLKEAFPDNRRYGY